jgi:hypothetical protein
MQITAPLIVLVDAGAAAVLNLAELPLLFDLPVADGRNVCLTRYYYYWLTEIGLWIGSTAANLI